MLSNTSESACEPHPGATSRPSPHDKPSNLTHEVDNAHGKLAKQLSHVNDVAPVYRLNGDLLLLIFEMVGVHDNFVLPCLGEQWAYGLKPEYPSPWAVSAVCRRWRATSLASPGLWSQISVAGGSTRRRIPYLSEYHLGIQLARSGDRPLCIRLDDSLGDGRSNLSSLLFASQAHRCQELVLLLAGPPHDTPPTETMDFANLRKLRVFTFDSDREYDSGTRPWTETVLFRTATQLTHLFVETATLNESFCHDFVPWENLQSLQLREVDIEPDILLSALSLMPNVSFLNIDLAGPENIDDDQPITDFVPMPSLRCLRLFFGGVQEASRRLIRSIQASNLERLEVSYVNVEDLRAVRHFLEFSSCAQLASFSMDNILLAWDDEHTNHEKRLSPILLAILRDLPALQRLYISHTDFKENFRLDCLMRKLTLSPSREAAVRKLEELHLSGRGVEVSSKILQAFIDSRLLGAAADGQGGRNEDSSPLQAICLQQVRLPEIDGNNSDKAGNRNRKARATLRWLLHAEEAGLVKYGVKCGSWDDGWEG